MAVSGSQLHLSVGCTLVLARPCEDLCKRKKWAALGVTATYAHYDGKDAPVAFDVDKFWAQVEFNF